ncbi:hypothetical protein QE390_000277 [Siphonobacter sp. SORGH_AS 1065]|nr:hypothetical protein [Siphonobacter sp. SORGH_AS_1065]
MGPSNVYPGFYPGLPILNPYGVKVFISNSLPIHHGWCPHQPLAFLLMAGEDTSQGGRLAYGSLQRLSRVHPLSNLIRNPDCHPGLSILNPYGVRVSISKRLAYLYEFSLPKLQTPNSKLQTPNSKLQTPNSKLKTVATAAQNSKREVTFVL